MSNLLVPSETRRHFWLTETHSSMGNAVPGSCAIKEEKSAFQAEQHVLVHQYLAVCCFSFFLWLRSTFFTWLGFHVDVTKKSSATFFPISPLLNWTCFVQRNLFWDEVPLSYVCRQGLWLFADAGCSWTSPCVETEGSPPWMATRNVCHLGIWGWVQFCRFTQVFLLANLVFFSPFHRWKGHVESLSLFFFQIRSDIGRDCEIRMPGSLAKSFTNP